MDPLGALIRLSEVTLLTDPGRGVAAALEIPNAGITLPIGKLVTAQVIHANSTPTLVNIGGKPFALNIPFVVRTGQVLNLQVSAVTPALQFRLLATSEAPVAQDLSVGLGAFHPAANASSQGSASQANVTPANTTQEQFRAPPLVSAMELTTVPDLGNLLAVQIKRQFEGPTPDLTPKPMQHLAPEAVAQSVTPPVARGDNSPDPRPTAPAAALAAAAEGSSVHSAVAAASGASLVSGAAEPRPNPVASTLEPAAWNGPVWPGQHARITIEPDQRRTAFAAPTLNRWNATLKLTLPNLGRLHAQVDWSTPGLSIRIMASNSGSANLLRSHSGELVDTLRSLEMRLQAIGVSHGE